MRIALGLLVLMSACEPAPVRVSGWQMENFFPFDGARTWEFTSDDAESRHLLIATLDPEATNLEDGSSLHEISYDLQCADVNDDGCEESWVRSVTWSTSRTDGIKLTELHGPDVDLVFDEPIIIAEDEMVVGESVTSGGFVSTFEGLEPCPVLWTDEWDTCAHLIVTGTGPGAESIVGEYWAVLNFNVVSLKLDSDVAQWRLSDATFEAVR